MLGTVYFCARLMKRCVEVSSGISAKAKWNVNQASVNRMLNKYINTNLKNIEGVVDWYAKQSADWIERFAVLSGSPTGTNWHRNKNEQRGFAYGARMDSGTMSRMIGYDTFPVNSEGVIGGEFGLLTPQAGGEQYFMDQEYGTNIKSGKGKNFFVNVSAWPHKTDKGLLITKVLFKGVDQAPHYKLDEDGNLQNIYGV